MRVLRCQKCGAVLTTEESYVENMMDALNEVNEKMEKAARQRNRKLVEVYQQRASEIKKLLKGTLHLAAEKNEHARLIQNEKSVLVHFLLDNNLLTMNKIHELELVARERARKQTERDEAEIKRLYGEFESSVIGKGVKDVVFNEFQKEDRNAVKRRD